MVDDLYPGSTGSYPEYLTNVNGTLFFSANGGSGHQLFETNGAGSGTQVVTNNAAALSPSQLTNVNGTLFFAGTPGGVNNSFLWEDAPSGVNPAGPQQLAFLGDPPGDFTNVNGTLFFADDDSVHGAELWQSDGTSGGTKMVADLDPGSQGSYPKYLTSVRGSLLFSATPVPVAGFMQPWVLPVSAATDTSLISTPVASADGQAATITATVQSAPRAPTATGTVAFKQDNNFLSVALLDSNGQATCSTTGLAVGRDTITAIYSGNRTFDPSQGDDSALPQVVDPGASTTALTSSSDPSGFGQTVTFTAAVSAVAPAPGIPTGTVDFTDGATDLTPGGISLVAGQATFSTSALAIGSHIISAHYSGDASFSASQGSDSLAPQVVQQAPTSTAVNSSADPSIFGQRVTFTATVNGVFPAAGIPTGTVSFAEGATVLAANVTLNPSGKATFQTTTLAFGDHLITAAYSGNLVFSTSTSNPAIQVVDADPTTTSLKSSLSPSAFGQAVTFTATVLATAPGSGTPKGVMTFEDGLNVLGAAVLNASGQATFSSTSLSVASHAIIAAYGGDSVFAFKGSSSSALAQTVTKAGSSTSLKVSVDPSAFGQAVVFTATVVASAPAEALPPAPYSSSRASLSSALSRSTRLARRHSKPSPCQSATTPSLRSTWATPASWAALLQGSLRQ